ncbi:MAG: hypothetical protein M1833_007078 [Piccolia ochrophora]|nr:MAG: hypothetical protein M1833_007078 [Piccolia ochrophora]
MIEFNQYSDVNLDENPIVVLSCGHFLTLETLDGLLEMNSVYEQNNEGEYVGLRDMSGHLTQSLPACPDCRKPLRQYATQRYNRVVNRAVNDAMTRRFKITNDAKLQSLDGDIEKLSRSLRDTRDSFADLVVTSGAASSEDFLFKCFRRREKDTSMLLRKMREFLEEISQEQQPAKKLNDATRRMVEASGHPKQAAETNTGHAKVNLSLDRSTPVTGHFLKLKNFYVWIMDKLICVQTIMKRQSSSSVTAYGGRAIIATEKFFLHCNHFFQQSSQENVLNLNVEARIYHARAALLYQSLYPKSGSTDTAQAKKHVEEAKVGLEEGLIICERPFRDAAMLRAAVEETHKQFSREFFEAVTAEEIANITLALTLGSTTGHWYNCQNGHPVRNLSAIRHSCKNVTNGDQFAVGECGMPMEELRCWECGAPVGGRNHAPAVGVTRATQLEA